VLLADDNADMREYLQRLLRPGYEVTTVTDGQAALEAARLDPPDILISDVMMPRLGGLALVAALRADLRTAEVPVLLLSARAGQEAAIEGLEAGADDYLVKPFSAAELLARVRANVELARLAPSWRSTPPSPTCWGSARRTCPMRRTGRGGPMSRPTPRGTRWSRTPSGG
jgi:DNA-binding response OmpR family regulator